MRRTGTALLVPVIAAAVLVGCGSTTTPTASPNAAVTVSGAFGKTPAVRIPAQQAGSDLRYRTEIRGTGPLIPAGDSVLSNIALYGWTGTTHKLLTSTFATVPELLPPQLPLPGLQTALRGQTVGSRVLAVLPPKYGYGAQGNPQVGITGHETLVWVVDLVKAFSPTDAAAGTHVSGGGGKLPTVSAAAIAPTVSIPKKRPPTKLVVQTLIKGTGQPLATGQAVVLQVVGVIWRTGKVFYSTWPSSAGTGGALSFQLGAQAIPAWNKALPGVRVGSRVMLVVPPSEGYGKTGEAQAGIKGTDTLVFVFDVLASSAQA